MPGNLIFYIFFTVICGFVIKGIAGFGDPLLTNPLLSMKMKSRDITPGLLPISLIFNGWLFWKNKKSVRMKVILPIALWVLLGIIPGTLILKAGTSWILKAVLGIFITGLGVEMLTRDNQRVHSSRPGVRGLVSFLSGVMSGVFGINLLFVAYLERTSGDRNEFKGSMCLVFFLENLTRAIVYIAGGIFTPLSLKLALISLPGAALGMWIGTGIDRKLSENRSKKTIIFIFIVSGLSVFVKALTEKFF